MWILETEPPRLLAPNKTYTFGRRSHKKDADFISFDGASISRNHLTLQVGEPNIGDFDAITQVKLTDLKSKFGTEVNKEPLRRGAKSFECPKMELQLGPSTTVNLVWKPVNITYGTGEKNEAHKVMWEHAQGILKPLDIKLSASFSPKTTHYLKGTHRTSKLALALAYNLPILTNQFLQTLNAVAPVLEEDFCQWPDESQFLEDPLWAPNPKRTTCFKGQNFVVYEDNQFTNLNVVIDAAGGTINLVKVSDKIPSSAILIKPKDRLLLKQTSATLFTEHSDILHSIKIAKPVIPTHASQGPGTSQAHESSIDQSQTTRKRPQKAGMMNFLTQMPPKTTSQSAGQAQKAPEDSIPVKQETEDSLSRRKRPARVTMMDFMVGKRQKLDPEPQPESSVEQVSQPIKRTNDESNTLSKRKRTDQVEDTHQSAAEAPTRESSYAPEAAPPAPPPAPFVDLDTNMSGLALVECALVITINPPKSSETNPEWQGKPNFKAFRRKNDKQSRKTLHQKQPILNLEAFPSSQPALQQEKPPSPEISFIDDVDKLPTKSQDPDADNEFGFKFKS